MAGAASTSKCFLLFILSTLTISSYGNKLKTLSHDTTFPTPTIVTVPATNPVTVNPTNPASTPLPIPSTTPVNIPPPTPINPPAPITVPGGGGQPITNPVTTYPAPTGNVPVVAPPAPTNNGPTVAGQNWCVAKSGASESAVQSALDYACGIGGADCSLIQQGGSCYNPITLQNHASYAFNNYYQKHPSPTSCDFGGTANLVNTNPSTGTCIYPSSASSLSSTPPTPTTQTPTTIPPPATTTTSPGSGASGSFTPPSVLNSSNPASVFGSGSPPVTNTSSSSLVSSCWQPFTLVTSIIIGLIILAM